MALKSAFPERRQFGRRLVAIEGTLEVPLRPPLPCRVLDLSTAGAMIEVDGLIYLPAYFRLYVARQWYDCHVRHRKDGVVGVVFV